jgi:hypothetical protein
MRLAIFCLLISCAPTWTRGDHYHAELRGTPQTTTLAQWEDYIAAGVVLWAPAFDASCPFPFAPSDVATTKFVALVTVAAWTDPVNDEGYATKPGIFVKVSPDTDHKAIIAHEFGHAMGLSHNTRLTSIMYPTMDDLKIPDAQDFKDARAAMGCK